MTGKRHKSKKYEQYYGEPYVPKTLKEVQVCKKCGKTLPENLTAHNCPYCGGTLQTKYIPKQKA